MYLAQVRFALAALLAIVFAGCTGGSEPGVIKIVSSMPRTGSAKQQTDTIVNGIRLALEEVDYKVGDFTIEYEDMDDATPTAGQWDPVAEKQNAERAVANPDVMAYIGTYNSGAAKIAMPILNQAGLLMISPANTSVELTKADRAAPGQTAGYRPTGKITYFRVVPTDDLQGPLAAEWARDMGISRVYVLHDHQVYGLGLAELFRERCEEIGVEVLGFDGIDPNAQNFRSTMTAIKALRPELVYFGGTTQTKAGQLVKDMVLAGLDAKFLAPDGCYEEAFIDAAGPENANGRCFLTFGGLPPAKLEGGGAEFVKKYRERYESEPEAYAVYGYECARVVLEAIRNAGTKDREKIIAACRAIENFEGALGTWSFDENGDTTSTTMSGITVRDGNFEFVKILKAEEEQTAQ